MSTVGGLHNIDQQTGSSSKTPNPVFQPRCSRTPLSQLNKGDSVWRDSRTYARSAIQALELKKQQQQENMQRSRIPPPSAVKPVYPADERWVKAYRKAFPTFKIYFDGIEDLLRKRLEEKVKLLGSSVEQFFSAKCTHIVTGRPVPDEVKATAVRRPAEAGAEVKNQENMTENESGDMFNTTRVQRSSKALTLKKTENVSRDGDIFEIAHKHKIKIWSVDKLQNRILPLLFDNLKQRDLPNDSLTHRPIPQELPRMLQEEKVFGPSTSKRGEHQGPNFVRFSSHYVFVEDVTGTYRPIVVKEYPKVNQNKHTPPWPTLRKNKTGKSPFLRDPSSDNRQHEHKQDKKNASPEADQNQHPGAKIAENAVDHHTPSVSLRALNNQQVDKLEDQKSALAGTKASIGMPSASGIHQFGTSRVVSTSGSAVHRLPQPLPPTENINRLDRRMISNIKANGNAPAAVTKPVPGDQNITPQASNVRTTKRSKAVTGKRRPPPKNFCENCQQRFFDLKQHVKEPRHQEYAKKTDNFAELDRIIELTRRRYKANLPSTTVEERSEVIDGPLPENHEEEAQEPEPSSTFVVDDSWEKFADIVW